MSDDRAPSPSVLDLPVPGAGDIPLTLEDAARILGKPAGHVITCPACSAAWAGAIGRATGAAEARAAYVEAVRRADELAHGARLNRELYAAELALTARILPARTAAAADKAAFESELIAANLAELRALVTERLRRVQSAGETGHAPPPRR